MMIGNKTYVLSSYTGFCIMYLYPSLDDFTLSVKLVNTVEVYFNLYYLSLKGNNMDYILSFPVCTVVIRLECKRYKGLIFLNV